jgi:Protein similar to CwfJ C-terminus 1
VTPPEVTKPHLEPSIKPTDHSDKQADYSDYLSDAQMNELGAKMLKAELTGNTKLAEKLKMRLEKAREFKKSERIPSKKDQVVLSLPTASGVSRPIEERTKPQDRNQKRKRVDTHEAGKRSRYYPDDDKYDIKQMFEREEYSDGRDQDIEFAKAISKVKESQQTDMADIFSDVIRVDKRKKTDEVDDAIREANRMEKVLDTCQKCFDSPRMNKDLIVHVGKFVYLSIPYCEALISHHLVISLVQHVPCTTMIDEEVWEEFKAMKKALTKFFFDRKEDLVFF